MPVPAAPRLTWCRWCTYMGPDPPPGTHAGPVADLLRLNTGIPPTPPASQQRLALLTLLDGDPANDDPAGFPNGRRPDDDVTDIAARAVAGILANPVTFGTRIGEASTSTTCQAGTFPYMPPSQDGRNSRHVDPGEPGCAGTLPAQPPQPLTLISPAQNAGLASPPSFF